MTKIYTFGFCLLLWWLPGWALAQNQPDLVVVAPFSVPTSVQAGATYPMSAVIKNQGKNGSQFNCIGYYLSADNVWDAADAYLGASCQSLMFPGQSGTCAISGTIPALTASGSYYLLLVADPLNAELELDETNNVVSFNLAVTAGGSGSLPDLELWRPSLSFSALAAGGSTGAFTYIFNRGVGSSSAYEIGYYLSADTVFSAGKDVFLGLATGGSLTQNSGTVHFAPVLTVPATTAPGKYYLLLMADPRNLIAEFNENNNSRALALQVTGTVTAAVPTLGSETAVFPNPAVGGSVLTVQMEGSSDKTADLTFIDALGKVVAHEAVAMTGRAAQFDTKSLLPGVYVLHIKTSSLAATRRVVIQ